MRVLVTGAAGQVGGAIKRRPEGLDLLPVDLAEMDLGKPEAIIAGLDARRPDLVVSCAAYTAVDQAEQEPDLAFAINATAPAVMARWCADHGRPLIHMSTDYVFPGNGTRPYREDDPVGPASVYGASKEAGERAVREACPRHIILRTAWVYAADGKNFVRTMLRLGAERPSVGVVADQRGCPTAAHSLAGALIHMAKTVGAGREDLWGTYHYVDAGETTWHGFAEAIFDIAATKWGRRPEVTALTTEQYPTPARRPAYSVLDTSKVRAAFGLTPAPWQDNLRQVMDLLLKEA